jgi:hypothetical protein
MHLYRRHSNGCKLDSSVTNRCRCPVWVYEQVEGKETRLSMKTRDLAEAERKIGLLKKEQPIDRTVRIAADEYLDDCRWRDAPLADSTLKSYSKILEHMAGFFGDKAISTLDLKALRMFRRTRIGTTPKTARKEIEAMRVFMQWCMGPRMAEDELGAAAEGTVRRIGTDFALYPGGNQCAAGGD